MKLNKLTGGQKFQVSKMIDKMRKEIESSRMNADMILEQIKGQFVFTVTQANVKCICKDLDIKLQRRLVSPRRRFRELEERIAALEAIVQQLISKE